MQEDIYNFKGSTCPPRLGCFRAALSGICLLVQGKGRAMLRSGLGDLPKGTVPGRIMRRDASAVADKGHVTRPASGLATTGDCRLETGADGIVRRRHVKGGEQECMKQRVERRLAQGDIKHGEMKAGPKRHSLRPCLPGPAVPAQEPASQSGGRCVGQRSVALFSSPTTLARSLAPCPTNTTTTQLHLAGAIPLAPSAPTPTAPFDTALLLFICPFSPTHHDERGECCRPRLPAVVIVPLWRCERAR